MEHLRTPNTVSSASISPSVLHALQHVSAWCALALSQAALLPSRVQAEGPPAATRLASDSKEAETVEYVDHTNQIPSAELQELLGLLESCVHDMDNDEFMIRERASRQAEEKLLALVQRVNPLPPEVEKSIRVILNAKRDDISPEQKLRVRWLNNTVEGSSSSAPTQITIPKDATLQEAIDLMQLHSGIRFDFTGLPDESLRDLNTAEFDRAQRSYVQLLRQVCETLNAEPTGSDETPDVVRMVPRKEEGTKIFTDPLNLAVCVLSKEDSSNVRRLRVLFDPQLTISKLTTVQPNGVEQFYNVQIDPTVEQQWEDAEGKIEAPKREATSYEACPPDPSMVDLREMKTPGLLLRGAVLCNPRHYQLPLGKLVKADTQTALATYDAEAKCVVVRLRSTDPADHAGNRWSETALCTNTFTVLDAEGKVIADSRPELVYCPDEGHVFDARIPVSAPPASISMRGYSYISSYPKDVNGDGFYVPLPREDD